MIDSLTTINYKFLEITIIYILINNIHGLFSKPTDAAVPRYTCYTS